ncbi:hypothetical protein [Billgrantia lactosivorans]|uniref:hypothetical protein n=1 Tax=Billgrantia lactosivorans TaxID=2185141 RepID=UPI0030ECBEE6
MSLLNSYLQQEQQLKQLQDQLTELESNPHFKKELEFKTKLEALMSDHDKSAAEVLDLLSPTGHAKSSQSGRKRS